MYRWSRAIGHLIRAGWRLLWALLKILVVLVMPPLERLLEQEPLPGGRAVLLAAGGAALLAVLAARPPGSPLPFLLLVVAGLLLLRRTRGRVDGRERGLELGEARLASLGDLRERGWLDSGGQPLGRYRRRMVYMPRDVQAAGTLIVAPTRQGKSSRVLFPALFAEAKMACEERRSLIIFDMKEEFSPVLAPVLAESHRVLYWNPLDPRTESFDPLGYAATEREVQDVMRAWEEASGGTEERGDGGPLYYRQIVVHVLTAAALYLRAYGDRPTMIDVAHYVRATSIERMANDLAQAAKVRPELAPASGRLWYLVRAKSGAGSAMTDIVNRLEPLALPEVRRAGRGNTIDWDRFIREPTALFIPIGEAEMEAIRPLVGVFFRTALRELEQIAGPGTGRLPRPVRVYMDEFANLGRLHRFDAIISTCAWRDIGLILATQSVRDVRAVYGEARAHRILDNCNTKMLLPNASLEDRTFFSDTVGETTLKTRTRSRRESDPFATHASRAESLLSYPLVGPERLRVMDEEMLVIAARLHAFTVRTCPWYLDPDLVAEAEAASTRHPLDEVFGRGDRDDLSPEPARSPDRPSR